MERGDFSEFRSIRSSYREYKGYFDEALQCHNESLEIEKEIGEVSGIATSLGNIAIVYCDKGLYDEASKYHHESLVIQRETGNKRHIALNLNNIGSILNEQGMNDEALLYFEESLDISKTIGDKWGIRNCAKQKVTDRRRTFLSLEGFRESVSTEMKEEAANG